MSELVLERVWSPPLKNVSVQLGIGLHVVLGHELDGTGDLVELVAGLQRPRRGVVSLDGHAQSASPAGRRRIAALLASEAVSGTGDVRRWLTEIAELRGFAAARALELLPAELEPGRTLVSLTSSERRKLALCLALGQDDPALVALHEPLAASPSGSTAGVLARIHELSASAVVVIATASIADARRLGGTLYVLERGVLARKLPHAWPAAVTPGLDVFLWVDSQAPRALLAELAGQPDVLEARYDERQGGRLMLRGADLERLALAVARAAVSAEVEVRALRVGAPDLEAAHGASAGIAHAAYRAAQGNRRGGPAAVRGSGHVSRAAGSSPGNAAGERDKPT